MVFGKHINKYYLRYGLLLFLGIVALVAVDLAQLKTPELYSMVIDGIKYGYVETDGVKVPFDLTFLLDKICGPMMLIILIVVLGRFLWRVTFFTAGVKVTTDLREEMFGHAKDLSLQYYQVNKVGNLMSLFTNDLETIDECFSFGILTAFDAIALGGLALYKMYRIHSTLTLLSMIPMVFMLACALIVGKSLTTKWDARQEAFSNLSDFTQENVSGIAVVKAFVKETKELLFFKALNDKNVKANVEYTRMSVLMRIFVSFFIESVMCIILGYGGYLASTGAFSAGTLVEFISYFTSIIWPIMAISELIDMTSRGRASMDRIGELLEAKIDVTDKPHVTPLADVRGEITFRDLTFTYPGGDYEVLKNINCHIPAGAHVGIIGRTGCGKTTLVDLILRTYEVPDGTVYIDGRDVNEVSIQSVREATAYVPQDNFLFSDTVANNISFGVTDGEEEEIRRYATLSDVHNNIVEFTNGYDTVLGERGVTVSGGQKQRISIARALMKNAPILILDDSVSAVDTATEKIILDNLRATRADMTTILIAHRVSTVQGMDQILFMDNGTLVDVGTHEELLARCEAYAKMVALQKLEDGRGEGA